MTTASPPTGTATDTGPGTPPDTGTSTTAPAAAVPATGTEPATGTAPPPATGTPDAALAALAAVVADLKLTPEQIAGRLSDSRKWETRAKANADAAGEKATLEQTVAAMRAELDQITADRDAQAKTAAEAQRAAVAAAKGIPVELLADAPLDQIEARAQAIAAFAAQGRTARFTTPEQVGAGAVGTDAGSANGDWLRQEFGKRRQ